MHLFLGGVGLAVFLYMLLLLGRALFSWVMFFSPDWKPRGLSLVALEACFASTDPPVHFLRRVLPTINVGRARVDLALPALFLACYAILFLLQFAQKG
jgi:YggT family protein